MCNARWNLSTRKLSPGQSVPRPTSPDVTSLSYVSPLLTPPQRIWLWHTPSSLLPLLSSSHRSPGIRHTHKTEITNNKEYLASKEGLFWSILKTNQLTGLTWLSYDSVSLVVYFSCFVLFYWIMRLSVLSCQCPRCDHRHRPPLTAFRCPRLHRHTGPGTTNQWSLDFQQEKSIVFSF